MRGKRRFGRYAAPATRITPADAGKTCVNCALQANFQDHPRGCGENCLAKRTTRLFAGSPPRMRGKRRSVGDCTVRAGITPADAGKTIGVHSELFAVKDHPRGCGENWKWLSNRRKRSGSPPRMRGKHYAELEKLCSDGITPADAGKTRRVYANNTHKRDHPRGCGENVPSSTTSPYSTGSPPRMRGKPAVGRRRGFRSGITPADAGKTL